MLDLSPLPWMDLGLCLSYPELDWFSEKRGPIEQAKAVCERCTVRDACLAYAKAEHIAFGVWGGTSPEQRVQVKRRHAGGECATCEFVSVRLIGDPGECDACFKYRYRTGRPRPAHVIAASANRRFVRVEREQERAYLRANVNLGPWDRT